ncbi:LysM peptidoglycan-binding domain-containing protein, partial [Sphingomonas sp. DT-204]|uniref:LysM peptidoglycan-binding domain-containing protein n=1 Tax=Sphingomonas sp. DT-204 TaxID=3396166 RepID=UPI003F1BB28A
ASVAEFDGAYAAINSYQQGASGGSYMVQAGDTLAGIAAQLWGDANLWYKLAAANGLTGDAPLIEGQGLTVPAGVVRSSNSASTFKPYEVGDAYGDTSPTTPKPKAAKKNNKCGVFGQVLLVAVAVAVSIWAAPAAPSVWQGAIAGVAGSVASQGVGVVTGIQDKFSLKGVALAGISGGVGAGIGSLGLDKIGGSAFLGDVARGALGNAATQGIAVATGLRSKFDWAGVAVGGVVGGVTGAVGREFGVQSFAANASAGNVAGAALAGTAGALAGAAARSLIKGTD